MPEEKRLIFRHEALAHLVEGQKRSVLPHYIRPRTFLCLWILLGLLLLALVLAWTARVPQFAASVAVVDGSPEDIEVVILVLSEHLHQLQPGQTVWLHWPNANEPSQARITSVDRTVQNPAALRERFALDASTINSPMVVAYASGDGALPNGAAQRPGDFLSATTSAEIEIGSRRALSLLPLVSDYFP